MLTVGSLFSGIGGIDLGLERAGFKVKWQIEIDDYCRKVLTKHWPTVLKYRDIRDCGAKNLEPVDLVCGGFPCQPFSHAGKRKGKEDDRYLWPEMLRVISELKPRWVLGENVAGIVNMGLDVVLSDLEGEGYETGTFVIPACAVYAPHRRDRVWILAYRDRRGGGTEPHEQQEERTEITDRSCAGDVAYAHGAEREEQWRAEPISQKHASAGCLSKDGAYAFLDAKRGAQGKRSSRLKHSVEHDGNPLGDDSGNLRWWSVEPAVGRVAHGIPRRVDRLKGLGNAVVPQIPEILGRMIQAIEKVNYESDVSEGL